MISEEALRQRGLVAALLFDAPSPVVAVDSGRAFDFHGVETFVLVASSPVTLDASRTATGVVTWDRAAAWAHERAALPTAPPVTPARLATIASEAGKAGLSLLEPDVVGPLGRVRSLTRSPLDRAVLALVAGHARTRAFVFSRNPKLRLRVGNVQSTLVARGLAFSMDGLPLVTAALDVLTDTPIPFKELLRRARASSRASGNDAAVLASALHQLSALDRVVLSVS